MSNNTRLDEKIIKDIIKQKTKYTNNNYKLDLVIYYRGTKTRNYIIKIVYKTNQFFRFPM